MNAYIQSYCSINKKEVWCNDQKIMNTQGLNVDEILTSLYRELNLNYRKFYKMDNLCKLAYLGSELLLSQFPLPIDTDDVGLVFYTKKSSLDSDYKHQELINNNQKVSPSIFVYTLPNILMGEIAIKNKWYGENLFLIAPMFNLDDWMAETQDLINLNKAKTCIGGWVDVFREDFSLKMFISSPEKSKFDLKNIKHKLNE